MCDVAVVDPPKVGEFLLEPGLGGGVGGHARRERFEHRKTQRELSEERFRGVGRPTPLPPPGVYARRNAVDSAALLPDGSYSELSVSSILQSRGADGAPTTPREAIPEAVKGGAS